MDHGRDLLTLVFFLLFSLVRSLYVSTWQKFIIINYLIALNMALLARDAFINGHDLHRNYEPHNAIQRRQRHRATIIFSLQFLSSHTFNLQFTAHVRYVCALCCLCSRHIWTVRCVRLGASCLLWSGQTRRKNAYMDFE